MDNLMGILPNLLFVACFSVLCGVAPLLFAVITFFSARKRGSLRDKLHIVPLIQIAQVQPGKEWVKVYGRIIRLAEVGDAADDAPVYALIRLRAEKWQHGDADERAGWRPFLDQVKTIPFLLADDTGQVWVHPQNVDKNLLGSGRQPDQAQLTDAIERLNIDPSLFQHGQYRFFLWTLALNDPVTVMGSTQAHQDATWIMKAKGQPMVLTSLPPEQILGEVASQSSKARLFTLLLGIPGALVLLVSFLYLLFLVIGQLL
jgi:hypothetical protein